MNFCNTINFLRYLIGGFGSISIIVSVYFYINSYDSLNCGDLKLGIGLGLTSLLGFVLSTSMYCSSCMNKIFIPISALFVIGMFSYNLYLRESMTAYCFNSYRNTKVWGFFNYLLLALGIISVLSIVFLYYVRKKKKEIDLPYEQI